MNNNKQELSDAKGDDVEEEEVLMETQKKIMDYKRELLEYFDSYQLEDLIVDDSDYYTDSQL